jgi:hypothetical protein
MDVYTNPPVTTYIKQQFFHMPTDRRSILGITFGNNSAEAILAAYTLLITFIFLVCWNIIVCLVAAFFKTDDNPNRYIGLVTFINSNEPWAAMTSMASYCWRNLTRSTSGDLSGAILLFLSVGIVMGNIIAGNYYGPGLHVDSLAGHSLIATFPQA